MFHSKDGNPGGCVRAAVLKRDKEGRIKGDMTYDPNYRYFPPDAKSPADMRYECRRDCPKCGAELSIRIDTNTNHEPTDDWKCFPCEVCGYQAHYCVKWSEQAEEDYWAVE